MYLRHIILRHNVSLLFHSVIYKTLLHTFPSFNSYSDHVEYELSSHCPKSCNSFYIHTKAQSFASKSQTHFTSLSPLSYAVIKYFLTWGFSLFLLPKEFEEKHLSFCLLHLATGKGVSSLIPPNSLKKKKNNLFKA